MAVTGHQTRGGLACIQLHGEKQPNKGGCPQTAADPCRALKLPVSRLRLAARPWATETSGLCELPALQQRKKANSHQMEDLRASATVRLPESFLPPFPHVKSHCLLSSSI